MIRSIELKRPSFVFKTFIKCSTEGQAGIVDVRIVGSCADVPARTAWLLNGHNTTAALNEISRMGSRLLGP